MKLTLVLLLAIAGCASNPPCKVTKHDPRIITHPAALDNPDWHCVDFGLNAQTKKPVYQCVSKIDGVSILVYIQ